MPGFRVLMATLVVPFQVPVGEGHTDLSTGHHSVARGQASLHECLSQLMEWAQPRPGTLLRLYSHLDNGLEEWILLPGL